MKMSVPMAEENASSISGKSDNCEQQNSDSVSSKITSTNMETDTEALKTQLHEVMRTNNNETLLSNCADSPSTQTRVSINGDEEVRTPANNDQKIPEIQISDIESTHADKTMTVPCRQLPGAPDMSPVTRRRRTVLAKKALELEKAGKITRLRVVGSNSVILEFRDKPDDQCDAGDLNLGSQACADRRGSRDDMSLIWKRYKSPRGERRSTVPARMKLGIPEEVEHC